MWFSRGAMQTKKYFQRLDGMITLSVVMLGSNPNKGNFYFYFQKQCDNTYIKKYISEGRDHKKNKELKQKKKSRNLNLNGQL